MILFWILVGLTILWTLVNFIWNENYTADALFSAVILSFCIYFSASVWADHITPAQYKSMGRTELVQLSDGQSTEGRFGLFSGYIEDKQYYFYYYENSKGIVNGKVPANITTIMEDSESAYLEHWDDQSSQRFVYYKQHPSYYELHVPEGTVIRSWKLDGN